MRKNKDERGASRDDAEGRRGGSPKPRLGRGRRPDRGLPGDDALRGLARTYLQLQRSLWPELAGGDLLPAPSDDLLAAMAERFRRQFLGGEFAHPESPIADPSVAAIVGCYLRYSSDNSNPRSLDQQLRLILERAKQNGHFVPWAYVFADAAVTGTNADRRGYILSKRALELDCLKALYIDEIGRASRDAVEAMRLGRLVEKLRKRLVGVSDGFDSSIQMSKMLLSMFATVQEWFIDQLRSKVNRGMEDAFARGTNLHPACVGYHLVPAVDADGRGLFGKDGERLNMAAILDAEAAHVLSAFEAFGLRGESPGTIAIRFNAMKVGGMQSWDGSSVRQLLRRPTYAGLEIYHRTYRDIDPETGEATIVTRPRAEWRVRRMKHLRIVPWPLWKAVRRRFERSRAAWARSRRPGEPTRADVYPKVLIRPVCGSCGAALVLGRSGKYPSLCCIKGRRGKEGCTFRGYKSVRIVDDAILGHLRRAVFTPEYLGRVVELANLYLREAAALPRQDAGPLEGEIRVTVAKRDRLVKLLDREGESDLGVLIDSLRRHERRLKELRGRLAELKSRNQPPPPPLTLAEAEAAAADLRGLLEEDVAVAAPLLRELTGPVVVDQIREPGRAKPTWIARFSINLAPVAAKLSASRDCPTNPTWEYLNRSGWTTPEGVVVRLETARLHESLAARAAEIAASKASVSAVARVLGTTWETARDALDFADSGAAPKPPARPRAARSRGAAPAFVGIAQEVARMRDERLMSFAKIGAALGVSAATASSAWDHAHRAEIAATVASGSPPVRGAYSRLGVEIVDEIRARLLRGGPPAEVAVAVGCSDNTVYRIRRGLRRE